MANLLIDLLIDYWSDSWLIPDRLTS